MKYILSLFVAFLIGAIFMTIPDLVGLYTDYRVHVVQKQVCKPNKPNECDFFKYWPVFEKDNSTLTKLHGYFLMGEGPIFMIFSGRCNNSIYYNPNATKDSGKITRREYFITHCSKFTNDLSDLIFQDGVE